MPIPTTHWRCTADGAKSQFWRGELMMFRGEEMKKKSEEGVGVETFFFSTRGKLAIFFFPNPSTSK
jgi:hypothetical protein